MTAPLILGPATRDIALSRGSTPRLRARLTSENVRTLALRERPLPGDVIEWRIAWPGAPRTASTAPGAPVPLHLDPVSRVIEYPVTMADVQSLPDAGVSYAITLTNADGRRVRFLDGTLRPKGKA